MRAYWTLTEVFSTERLLNLDAQGYVVVEALAEAPLAPSKSYSRPSAWWRLMARLTG